MPQWMNMANFMSRQRHSLPTLEGWRRGTDALGPQAGAGWGRPWRFRHSRGGEGGQGGADRFVRGTSSLVELTGYCLEADGVARKGGDGRHSCWVMTRGSQ